MSDFSGPYPPAPPTPYGGPAGPPPPGNGLAVTGLVLGISALVLSPIPIVNLLGIMLALPGLVFAGFGIRRGRTIGRGTAMAGWGAGLSCVALVVSSVVGFLTFRYLGDLLDFVEPPDPSAEIGEEFDTDDGDLTVTVTSAECAPSASASESGSRSCTFVFTARYNGSSTLYLDSIKVKAVIAGAWQDPSLDGETTLGAGESSTITGTVTVYGEDLEGLAFDADDASSHSAVVVDVRSANSRTADPAP
ncbi:hypothetical protein ASE01_18720 [Nocardioides sp. Root190]|uniref:hypothetical protein n=1 Tax=Nocardioides sp. Root190 TaxID=1736488 RepID=UPI0006FE71E3|nr:hypothetical protein [Nocardioides sp. Root190]KRB74030.1 hypothetical protein ASE01_18720 [Nocardioides sp. Root190]